MNNIARIILFVCVCLFVVSAEHRQPSINEFARLAGCWENHSSTKQRDETWSKPNGGMMVGFGRVVVNGKTTEYEFMRLHQESDGFYFTAQHGNQAATSFKLISVRNHVATFENLQHDFPQRIIYDLNPTTILKARIEGAIEGKQHIVDFTFTRAKCENVKK